MHVSCPRFHWHGPSIAFSGPRTLEGSSVTPAIPPWRGPIIRLFPHTPSQQARKAPKMTTAAAAAQGQTPSPILISASFDDLTRALSERAGVPEDERLAHASAT